MSLFTRAWGPQVYLRLNSATNRIPWQRIRRYNHPSPSPSSPVVQHSPRLFVRIFHQVLSPFVGFIRLYGRQQRRHPWQTQLLTALGIHVLGDTNAQLLFPATGTTLSAHYDYNRTLRMTITGLILAVPGHIWYTRVSYAFSRLPTAAAVLARVAISQIVFSPVFLAAFFGIQGLLEGRLWSEVVDKIRFSGVKAWKDGLAIWPLVGIVNFWIVPLEYRALLGGVVSIGWNTWLSYLNAAKETGDWGVESKLGLVTMQAPPTFAFGRKLIELEIPILA